MNAARRDAFARLHRPGAPLFLPNAWDYASAAALAEAGFPAIGTTSLGVAAAAGKPDAAAATRDETLALAVRIARLPSFVTVDIEAGFSDDPDEVAALAAEVQRAGAVGINIEDGRADETLDAVDAHVGKVAAVKARVPELFVNARTDAYWLGVDDPFDEAVRRAKAYLDAGADGIFVPAAADPPLVRALCAAIPAPVNVLYSPGAHTAADLAASGVARISTGSLLFRESLAALVRTARTARDDAVPADPDRPTYARIQEMLGG